VFVFVVRCILRKPDVKGLEDDDNISPPQEPLGLDFSSPWRQSYLKNRKAIKSSLHLLHPTTQSLLRMGHESLSTLILIDCYSYRSVDVVMVVDMRAASVKHSLLLVNMQVCMYVCMSLRLNILETMGESILFLIGSLYESAHGPMTSRDVTR